ncbi:MAG: tetratricopeptide repeat protein, partial [Saprospiraceae bacterium]|nr:tetratricopeptide repeat protein [Saprospiraceae bacterium]
MKSNLIILFLVLGTYPALSQPDSLYTKNLLELSDEFLKRNSLDSAQQLVDSIYNLYGMERQYRDKFYVVALLLEANILERKGMVKDALSVIDSAMAWQDKLEPIDSRRTSQLLHKKSVIENRLGKYQDALVTATSAYEWALEDTISKRMAINALMAMSSAHFRLYHTQEAIELTQRALEMQEQLDSSDHASTARLMSNLANRYKDLRRYDKALHYLSRVLTIQKAHLPPDARDVGTTHFNIALNLQSKDMYAEAIKHYQESGRITSLYVPDHPYVAEDYQKIGACQVELGMFAAALENYAKAMAIYQKRSDRDVSEIALYSAYGALYDRQGDYKRAVANVDLAIELAVEKLGPQHPKVAGYLNEKTIYLVKQNEIVAAKNCASESLEILGYNPNNFHPQHAVAKDHLYNALGHAGYAHLSAYHQSGSIAELQKALTFYQHSITILDGLRQDLQDEGAKHLLSNQTITLFEHAIETAYFLHLTTAERKYAELALQFSEMSRRSTVLEAILSHQPGNFPGLPSTILERERHLQSNISDLENQILASDQSDEESLARLKDGVFSEKEKLYSFQDSLKEFYPEYYAYRYLIEPIDIGHIQSSLIAQQIILEYFDGEECIYAFKLTSHDLEIQRIPRNNELNHYIESYLTHISNADSILLNLDASLQKWSHASHGLYKFLLKPMLGGGDFTEILIIPDGSGAPLVFDVFLTEEPTKNDPGLWPYLFNHFKVSYAQSVRSWDEQRRLRPKPTKNFVGFAPNYQELEMHTPDTFDQQALAMLVRAGEINLPGAKKEIFNIQKIMSGKVLIDNEATERGLIESISPY